MTEMEMIKRAKMYIDKMANGINPLTDAPIPEDDFVNNVRISRCLFFVSELLRRMQEEGDVHREMSRTQKAPFALTAEQAAQFAYSEQPLRISEIVKAINSLIDPEAMKALQTTTITGWLVEIGMLKQSLAQNGRKITLPTERGSALGISTEYRNTGAYSYEAVIYDINAQHFILDNLDAAVAAHAGRTDRHGQPWSEDENRILSDLLKSGVPMKDIAVKLKRKTSAVRSHAKHLGFTD